LKRDNEEETLHVSNLEETWRLKIHLKKSTMKT
jgi:hypothetical protein